MMKNYKFWFCTGSQDLYGDECLRKVAEHSAKIVENLNASGRLPYEVVCKPTLISQASIRKTLNEANGDELCAGVITWMHTFSPAKMWIIGLQEYRKPLCHLHTQFNEEIPYDEIDMDFMNENQSAHGDREYGHIVSRMGIERKIIVGHWANPALQEKLKTILDYQLKDTVKASVLQPDGSYAKVDKRGKEVFNAQLAFCKEAKAAAKEKAGTVHKRVFIPKMHHEESERG